jgi:dTDP-4-dehydrorhamnose 3,5-epimerase
MIISPTYINELFVAQTTLIKDSRGSFSRLFCIKDLTKVFGERNIVQINQSITTDVGAVRGMHFQYPPHSEMKLVRCIRGKVWDVAVDMRKGSPAFLKWYAEELSGENQKMMIIPEGFAHGFQVLEPDSQLLYLHTAFYSSSSEGGIHPMDPVISIEWPLTVTQLSIKDELRPMINQEFKGISI